MGSVRQYERRALETATLNGYFPQSFTHKEGLLYFLYSQEIFFCGVSPGVGTCSSIKDRDIGVFTLEKPSRPPFRAEEPYHYAALVRALTIGEIDALPLGERNGSLRFADALVLPLILPHYIRFYLIGMKELFVEIV